MCYIVCACEVVCAHQLQQVCAPGLYFSLLALQSVKSDHSKTERGLAQVRETDFFFSRNEKTGWNKIQIM